MEEAHGGDGIRVHLVVNVSGFGKFKNAGLEEFEFEGSSILASRKIIFESDYSIETVGAMENDGQSFFRAETAEYVGNLVDSVTTKFLLLAENLSDYKIEDHSLFRLVREIDAQGLDFI